MKLRFTILTSLMLLASCNKDMSNIQAPKSLEGKTLWGTVRFGSGEFSGMEAYSFKTTLDAKRAFTTISSANTVESQGDYSYKLLDNKTGKLILTARSGTHAGQQIEVTLQFSSSDAGTYSGKFLSGQPGDQNGTFELK